MKKAWRQNRTGWLFASPWLLGFCALTLFPLVASVLLSFCRWDGLSFQARRESTVIDDFETASAEVRWSLLPAGESLLEVTVQDGQLRVRKRGAGVRYDGELVGVSRGLMTAERHPDGTAVWVRLRGIEASAELSVRLRTEALDSKRLWLSGLPLAAGPGQWQELCLPLARFRLGSDDSVELRSQDIAAIEFFAPRDRFPSGLVIDEIRLERAIGGVRWVGTNNYRDFVLRDRFFGRSLFNTAYYSLISVPLGLAISLGLAMLLNQPIRGISVFRTIYYLPHVVAGVATMMMWLWVFDPEFGLLNALLRDICAWFGSAGRTGLGVELPRWLYEAGNVLGIDYRHPVGFYALQRHFPGAKDAMIVMSVWGAGGGMLIFLAALQNVPQHLYEAARIDGAGRWRQFISVTIPHISPAIFFNLVIGIIASFQVFTPSYLMTNRGGPDTSTLYYVLYLYLKAFEDFQMGYASAMAWVLFVLILALTLLVLRSGRYWVYYGGD